MSDNSRNSPAVLIALVLALIAAAGFAGWKLARPNNSALVGQADTSTTGTAGSTLDLSGKQLTTLPDSVLAQTNLKVLNVSNNQLAGLPANIIKLVNLEVLNIENNRLESFPSEITQLTGLREIYANNNRLTTLSGVFDDMTNLKLLDISGNNIPASEVEQLKTSLANTQIKY